MAKEKEPVPEILKVAKDGTEGELLDKLVNGAQADTTPKALAAVFFCAAGRGFLTTVAELLNRGVDASTTNGHLSGLGMAGKYAKSEVVKLLLTHGAQVDVRNDLGETPLILACKEMHWRPECIADYRSTVMELLAAGADPNAEDCYGNTALIYACEGYAPVFEEDLTIPRLLIVHGVNLKHYGCRYSTALQVAAKVGNLPLVELLLEHGHPVDLAAGIGYTPLMIASLHGRTTVVQLLLQYNAGINLAACDGTTALVAACEENLLEIVKTLIAAGADWKTATVKGSVREIAEQRKAWDVVRYLDSLS